MNNKFHTITIRKRHPTAGLQTGANTEVLLDGEPLKGCSAITFSVKANGTAKTIIEMFGNVEIDAEAEVDIIKLNLEETNHATSK